MSKGTSVDRARHTQRRIQRTTVVSVVVVTAVTLAAFLKLHVGPSPYEIRGIFASTNQLRIGSDVRIAGVTVGHVTALAAGPGNTAVVTMQVDDVGRPIHADAELAVEPRLVLEGNFYVAVRPGTPSVPELHSGATIPRAHTTVPVQLDQVLDTFDLATRGSLHRAIGELASALGPVPHRHGGNADRATVPAGYVSLRQAARELRRALPPAARVATALRGSEPGDLGRTVRATRDVTTQLAAAPAALADSVTNFNRLTATLADEDRSVVASIGALDHLMRVAPPGLAALNGALPQLTTFADALRPALRIAPAPLRRATGLVRQLQRLFGDAELPALLDRARPAIRNLPSLEQSLLQFSPLVTSANGCLTDRVAWTLNQTLKDGTNSTGDPVWLDAVHGEANSGGVVSGFDGNGVALRVGLVANGTEISGVFPGIGKVVGTSPHVEGVRPAWLGYGVEPPYRPDQSCTAQQRPDLSARSAPPPSLPRHGGRIHIGGILP